MEDLNVTAHDSGELMTDTTAQQEQEPQPRSVPYTRFAEVNSQKKAAETALSEVVAAMVEDLPEQFRALVPELPPTQRVAWIRQAKAAGIFAQAAPTSSPDPVKPISRPDVDLNTQTPLAMMRGGYQ